MTTEPNRHNKRALTRQTSPIYTTKEPERQNTRTLYIPQHTPTRTRQKLTCAKEPYTRAYRYDKNALHTRQKNPLDTSKESFTHDKRVHTRQKSPLDPTKEYFTHDKRIPKARAWSVFINYKNAACALVYNKTRF